MARFLGRATPKGDYTKGDIVAVVDSGAPMGAKETLPDFFWVDVPSVTVADLEPYRKPLLKGIQIQQIANLGGNIRRYRFSPRGNSPAESLNTARLTDILTRLGATNVVDEGDTVRADMERITNSRQALLEDVMEQVAVKRQYQVQPDIVDDIVAQGGFVVMTQQEAIASLVDKAGT